MADLVDDEVRGIVSFSLEIAKAKCTSERVRVRWLKVFQRELCK